MKKILFSIIFIFTFYSFLFATKFYITQHSTTTLANNFVLKAGDTMTGDLNLPNVIATDKVEGSTGIFNNSIGIRTTTPTEALDISSGNIVAKGSVGAGDDLGITGNGTRLIWYPKKAAFRFGRIDGDYWNDSNIGTDSFAGGYNVKASGTGSFGMGTGDVQALGNNTFIHGTGGTIGRGNTAVILGGAGSTADGDYGLAAGPGVHATAHRAKVIGQNLTGEAYSMFLTGRYNVIGGSTYTWVDTDPLFVVGNGASSGSRSNAITILKNGNLGRGTTSPIYSVHISSSHASELLVPLLLDNELGAAGAGTGLRLRAVSATGDVRCKAGIFFERTGAGGVGSLHLAVEGTNDDSNADLTDAKLTINSSGNTSLANNLTIGSGAAGIDYTLTFDGESNDGVITWLEDEDIFDMSCGFRLNAGQEVTELSIDGTLAGNSDTAIPTEKAVKTYIDNLTARQYFADQLETPNNSDWTVNALATLQADSNNAAFLVRNFDDTTEEGVGFSINIPVGVSSMTLTFVSRAETAPAGARTVGLKLYERGLPAAVDSWSAGTALTDIDISTNENWVYDTQTDSLTDWGITAGQIHQFELTRVDPAGGTELSGDWVLYLLMVEFE